MGTSTAVSFVLKSFIFQYFDFIYCVKWILTYSPSSQSTIPTMEFT